MTNDTDCSSSQTNGSGSEDSNSDREERPSGNMSTPPRDEDSQCETDTTDDEEEYYVIVKGRDVEDTGIYSTWAETAPNSAATNWGYLGMDLNWRYHI